MTVIVGRREEGQGGVPRALRGVDLRHRLAFPQDDGRDGEGLLAQDRLPCPCAVRVAEGASGGLVTMLLFVAIIWRCFEGIGRAIRVASREERELVWGLGAALMAHVATFFSVTYFDQNYVNWYLLLAMISTATSRILAAGETNRQQKSEEAYSLPGLSSPALGRRQNESRRDRKLGEEISTVLC